MEQPESKSTSEKCENLVENEKAKWDDMVESDNNLDFNVKVIKQMVNSVTIDWDLIDNAEVYEIEKYHGKYGWQKWAWSSHSPAVIENLYENYAYKFRIKALTYSEEIKSYVQTVLSKSFVASTISAQPTTLNLHRAIKKGQRFVVKRILRRRPSLIEYPGPNGYLPLANAIILGDDCILEVLLDANANVQIGNPQNGRTPLHLAFYYGRLSVARILLNKKASPEATDANGLTACHFAIDGNQHEILKYALENGVNIEARDAGGWTLLHRAVIMHADFSIIKLLLMHGADVHALDNLGQSSVDLARLFRNEVAADYFARSHKTRRKEVIGESKEIQVASV